MVPAHIFRQYDIRGVHGKDLTEEVARAVGWAFGERVRRAAGGAEPTVALGRDARLSSPSLHRAFAEGAALAGCRIWDLGMVPTPLTYYAAFRLEPAGFAMVTGSHNPPQENGFKLGVGKETFHSEALQELGREAARFPGTAPPRVLPMDSRPVIPMYQEDMLQRFQGVRRLLARISRPVKVVLDSGNGTAGVVLPSVLSSLGFSVTELFSEPDGRFPNHHPDPTLPDSLELLRTAVAREGAELGIGFDGDADRIGVLDEKGTVVWGDMLLLILARDILADAPPGIEPPLVISEVKASQVLYDEIARMGGRVLMGRTGHSLIKARMRETGAVLAGEMSGHLFFADRYYGFDDALYAALRLLEVFSRALAEGKVTRFSGLLEGVPRVFNTPEIRVPSTDEGKFPLVENFRKRMEKHREGKKEPRIRDIITVDGVRVVFQKGWGLLRASNTQPVLVMRAEARTEDLLEDYKAFLDRAVEESRG